ncbi:MULTISPECIES: MFS transporter [unclassified Arcicella]|uniref:POT-type proton-dependent oligopeptide transporter n=1 Tax=unclassified Arcicella TaxID=2644986 RepID=UPI00285E0D92|nr:MULTISPECIES: MFS transporter [unclassified Arcicella]MDR6563022.1 POT family proton-dependent oligopeptide transporter [Arcicella sp. BE51]MDR6813106.1 POT family proton-dependent oligopeptide transporter [Arcicella sp. BE140]MDR6824420.1 POT family proton-dependent oligopeptide transporter [Arcicella sp. BE139]
MTSKSIETEVVQKSNSYPKAVPYIIGNEAAERFSFYGMRSILPTFLIAQFFNPTFNPLLQQTAEAQSNQKVHMFVALAYIMPILGGIAADWFFGKYKVILYVSILYCFGHLMLAMFDTNLALFSLGLIVIAAGAGGIKSNVSANVGDQFDKTNEHFMSKVYGWFYFSINSGSVVSNICIPIIYKNYGAAWAFGVPGILMVLATIIFFSGRNKYVKVPPMGINRNNFIFISFYALINIGKKQKGDHWLDVAKANYDPQKVDDIKAVYRLIIVFAFIPIFWALWDQNLSEWVLQAQKIDLNTGLGFALLPEQVQVFNPFFLVSFIPVFTYFVYPFFDKLGIKTTPLRRLGVGFFLTALSFVIIALIQESIDGGGKPSVWWQILAYLVLAWGEILVSITGLEYAYTNSPKSMKSTMTAIFYSTVSIGNLAVSLINENIANKGFFAQLDGAKYFWFFAGLMFISFLIYISIASKMKETRYVGIAE